jgi:hypothetical protein
MHEGNKTTALSRHQMNYVTLLLLPRAETFHPMHRIRAHFQFLDLHRQMSSR